MSSLIKKALIAAGFEDVPVVTLSTSLQTLNEQPGFEFNTKELHVQSRSSAWRLPTRSRICIIPP